MILPRTSEGLYLLQRVRDEAHRFAITHHRSRRSKTMVESLLDDVPGLGEVRRKTLLKHFGSLKKLRAATVDEIAAVPGIGPRTAEAIAAALGDAADAARLPCRQHRHRRDLERATDGAEPSDPSGRGDRRRAGRRHRHDRRRPQHRRQGAGGPRLVRGRQPAAAAAAPTWCGWSTRAAAPQQPIAVVVDVRSGSFFDAPAGQTLRPGRHRPPHHAAVPRGHRRRAGPPAGGRPPAAPAAGRRPAARRPRAASARCSATCAATPTWSSTPPTSTSTSSPTRSRDAFGDRATTTRCRATVVCFGFKYGIPVDADFVADMRFLPNPHWVPELRPLTGRDADGRRLRPGPARRRRSSSTGYVAAAARPSPRGYLARGQALHDRRDRLHRRQAPQRRDGRGDRRAGCATRGIDARPVHRDLGRE